MYISGDLFESEDDLVNPVLWRKNSQQPELQEKHRRMILSRADVIIPGHGEKFTVDK